MPGHSVFPTNPLQILTYVTLSRNITLCNSCLFFLGLFLTNLGQTFLLDMFATCGNKISYIRSFKTLSCRALHFVPIKELFALFVVFQLYPVYIREVQALATWDKAEQGQ